MPEIEGLTVNGLAQLCQARGADDLLIHTVPADVDGMVRVEALAHFPDGHTVVGHSREIPAGHATEFPCTLERVQACTRLRDHLEPRALVGAR